MMSTEVKRRGLMLVLSSPSGAGKTSLSRKLLAEDENISLSVSVTTRPPRPGEVDGRDYFFVDAAGFERLKADGNLLEYATVFSNSYGTPAAPVEEALKAGKDVLFDIDWQGTQQLQERAERDLVKVFILPPSAEALHERLRSRAQDSEEVVAQRMKGAAEEISHYSEYTYVLINDDLERCFQDLKAILAAERRRAVRQTGLRDYVNGLRAGLD